jgi:hypothetical protein
VRVQEQILSPCVKDAEETDLGSKMFRIPCHAAECFGDSAKKQVVEFRLILQDERVEFMRQREDHMEVPGWKQFQLPRVDPSATCLSLTLVAVTIATAVV